VRLAISAKVHRLRLRKFFNAVPGLAVDMLFLPRCPLTACEPQWLMGTIIPSGGQRRKAVAYTQTQTSETFAEILPALPNPSPG
jgi:hypothetical protein